MRFCRPSLGHEGVLGIDRLVVSLFRRCITFLQRVQVMQQMTLAEVEVKCQLARFLCPFVLVPRNSLTLRPRLHGSAEFLHGRILFLDRIFTRISAKLRGSGVYKYGTVPVKKLTCFFVRPRLHGSGQNFARTNFVPGQPVYMDPYKFCYYTDPCKV